MGHGQRLGQLVEGFTAYWAVGVLGGAILLVALTGMSRVIKDQNVLMYTLRWVFDKKELFTALI